MNPQDKTILVMLLLILCYRHNNIITRIQTKLLTQSLTYDAMVVSLTDMYVFAMGADIDDDVLKPLTTTKNDEQHYFRLPSNFKDLQRSFDSIIGR